VSWLRTAVRRWGWKTVGAVITAFGIYVVLPSVITLLGAWPDLGGVRPWWFLILAGLELASFAALWVLVRISLPHTPWAAAATSQVVGNAAAKVLPGGAAAGGVAQGRVLVQAGQPTATVATALTATGLLTTGVLLALPVLTVPAVIIGPPPARQLQLGLLVSVIVAVAVVALGTMMLAWDRFVAAVGRAAGFLVHVVRRSVTPSSAAAALFVQRDEVAAAFAGRWKTALALAAANRMFDYSALVAALYAVGAHIRPSMVLLAYVVAMALATVPITPGGLGVVEAGLTALLVLAGVSADQAAVGTLLYRLASYWLPIPLGALAWAGWQFRHHLPDDVHRAPGPEARGSLEDRGE
jgi:uncharacterized protein (TIRG00374 family)